MVKSGVSIVCPKWMALIPNTMISGSATMVNSIAHSTPSLNLICRFHRHHTKNTNKNAVTEYAAIP